MAKQDYLTEAFGSSAVDNEREAYYDACDNFQDAGMAYPTFTEWREANAKARAEAAAFVPPPYVRDPNDTCPF